MRSVGFNKGLNRFLRAAVNKGNEYDFFGTVSHVLDTQLSAATPLEFRLTNENLKMCVTNLLFPPTVVL